MKTTRFWRALSLMILIALAIQAPLSGFAGRAEEPGFAAGAGSPAGEDPITLVPDGQIEDGATGDVVLYLQQQLAALGYLQEEPTGVMDDATQDALTAYRAAHSLEAGSAYIGNRNTKKFHKPDCNSVGEMKESNKVRLASREDAIALGYVPCKRCKP